MRINVGPQHPSTHGVFRAEVEIDGEIVTELVPHIGYLHRCFEKHCEKRNFHQIVPYTDRLDYVSSMNNEWPYIMAVEKLAGIEVSEKVEILRVICAELNRIANHELCVATFGLDCGAFTPFLWLFRDREFALAILEKLSGGRLLYNYFAVGGMQKDIYPELKKDIKAFVKRVRETVVEVNNVLTYNKIFVNRTANVGILPKDVALSYACSGPVARASGIDYDLRKNEPYSVYNRFDFKTSVIREVEERHGCVGDSWNRNWVRVLEMEESCKILEQAIEILPEEGDVTAGIPKKVKVPKGEVYAHAESPKGEMGFYVVSNGKDIPERCRCRSASFVNLACLPDIVRGTMFADMIVILASIDIVLGDVDR